MANENLGAAKKAKNDEFYSQYHDIEKEINAYLEFNPDAFRDKTVLLPCDDPEWSNFTKYFAQKFEELGLRQLISTSYAPNSKPTGIPYQPTLFEMGSEEFDEVKTESRGKIFRLTKDKTDDGLVNVDDLEWNYLEGDGDFRSEEVGDLLMESDIVVTNPPFSLFREFLGWLVKGERDFVIIGNMNAVTYKELFPLIMNNKVWFGATGNGSDMVFRVPTGADVSAKDRAKAEKLGYSGDYTRLGNSCWFTTLDHGRRHEPLALMTREDNLKFNRTIQETGYQEYDNYDAIEVPRTEAIPSDYEGVLGVPISFLSKYNPDQFEIIGMAKRGAGDPALKTKVYTAADYSNYSDLNAGPVLVKADGLANTYPRVLIRHKRVEK